MPVIEAIALLTGAIAFIMTFAYTGKMLQALPEIDAEALTNMVFSAIVCLVSVGIVAYAEIVR